jgi:acyl carrier protein
VSSEGNHQIDGGPGPEHVRSLITSCCADKLAGAGVAAGQLTDDLDLRTAGVMDSLGFLELVVDLERELGVELDFETLDPEQLTTVGPLIRHVAAQAAAGAALSEAV